MGKRIVIKGADFSKNGMKSVNYVESIFCVTYVDVDANKLPMVIAENINCKHTIKFEVELINNATTFDIIGGWYDYANEGGPRRRMGLGKPYKSGSAGEETFIIAHQWGTGIGVNGKTDVTSGIHEFTFADGVFIDGEKMPGNYNYRENIPLEKVSLYTGTVNNSVVSVKWRHIEIINPEGETIKDLYPALNDGKACLYDEISKSFIYGSEGYEWQYE